MKQKLLMMLALAMVLVWSGNVWGQSRDSWTETFDDQTSNTYSNVTYDINGRTWTCSNAGNFSYGNSTMGSPAFVINDDKSGAHITTPVLNTCANVSFKYAYKSGSSTNVFVLQKSTDGTNYTDLDTHELGASSELSYVDYSFTVNDASATVYIRILSDDQNAHLFIDDYTVTDFAAGTPIITLSESSLSGFTYATGSGPSPEQSFTAEGTNLTDDITITPPTNYEISLDNITYQTTAITLDGSSGSVATTTIYVRLLAGLSAGDYNSEDIVASSTDATSQTITCSGSVYEQIDWANIQWPGTGTIARYDDYNVYAQVYESGVTDSPGQGAGITVWIGYSTSDTDPSTWTDWVEATYNTDSDNGNNDEYMANIGASITTVGTYYYASRFQLGSAPYIYGGFNGGFWDGTTNVSGVLTVNALPQIEWANLQWPGSGTIDVGGSFDVYARVFKSGITEAEGQGAGITAWIGYSTTDTDPSTWSSSSWITASFNGDAGNNDEYVANISASLPSGTYYYASRFQLGAADYVYGGFSGGFWDGTNNVSGVLTINVIEPTNHATSFSATANSSSKITVSWTDAVPFVEGYLIKASTVGYTDIVDPVDGAEESDGELVQNVGPGIGTFQFTGLTASTDYFFKIYPYNGTGAAINYNVDVDVPEATAITTIFVMPNAWVNEIHYDNVGEDIGEFVEVVIENAGNYNLADFQIDLYNGGNSTVYSTKTLDLFTLGNSADGFTFFYYVYPTDGIQNGAPDGLALSYDGVLITNQFLSYEGSFTATGGPAEGEVSMDIGVTETNSTPVGESLQLGGNGGFYSFFIWQEPLAETPGALNINQNIGNYTTWTGGNSDTDWTSAANWNNGVPNAAKNVFIPAGLDYYPTLLSAASCNNLTIESTASADGSLIGQSNLTVNGTTTIQRYTTAGTWHGISAPLAGDDFSSLYLNGNPDVWAKSYDEVTGQYIPASEIGTLLGDMKGWMVWIGGSTAQTFDFNGTLRSGTVGPVTLTNSGPDPLGDGYNFVGNPFPSAIDWEVIQPTTTNLGAGIWIWDYVGDPLDDNKNWATYLIGGSFTNGGSKDIAMGQGFFVQVNPSSSEDFEISESAQLHSTASFMKEQTNIPANLIKLKLTDGTRYDESIIRLDPAATENYDFQYDMHKMFSWSEEQPQLYSTANNFMTVNALPFGTVSVPMDVRGVDGNEMTIAIEEVTDFEQVYLSDDYTGVQTNLMENPYTFIYDAGQTDRFTVYFTIVGTTENQLENAQVYSFDKKIRVIIPMEMNAHVEVTNMLGQTVNEMDAHLGTHDINMAHGGYYLVTITGDNQRITRKVFIK